MIVADPAGTTLLLSDIHANYHVVNAQIGHATDTLGREVERVTVLGDFGLFAPDLHDHFRRGRQKFARPVCYIEGNHEDFRNLPELVAAYADVATHLPRGSVRRWAPGAWLCIGGARYMDAWSTPPGSEISPADIALCLEQMPGSIDVVISHDCPTGIGVPHEPGLEHLGPPGVDGLARIAAHLQPRYWFFGHHHRWHDVERDGTRYIGLPQSWQGYALMDGNGDLELVTHEVPLPRRPGWLRWIGLK
jgi:hypothetical protein